MRILVYGLNYAPELTGIGKYTSEMAVWLAGRGHHVRVVTAPPYYPGWRIHDAYRHCLYRTERGPRSGPQPAAPTVYRTPLWVPAHPRALTRLLHLFSFALGSLPVMLRQIVWRPQLVFTVEPTLFAAPIALLTAAIARAPAWLHIQDFEVTAAFHLDLLSPRGHLPILAARLDSFLTRRFARVSSISGNMVERIRAKGVPARRAVLFPNWADLGGIYPSPSSSLRRELGLEGKIVLLYSGNMGCKQGLEALAPLVSALAPASNEEVQIHFLLCGDGAFRPQLEALLAGRSNVSFLPLQPAHRLNALLNTADIHLLPQRRGAADLVMPSKLTGMLASGRPILATADPGTQVALVLENCGLAVPPGDAEALRAAARRLIDDPILRTQLGAAARTYAVRHLGKEQVLLRFEQNLLALLGPSQTALELPADADETAAQIKIAG